MSGAYCDEQFVLQTEVKEPMRLDPEHFCNVFMRILARSEGYVLSKTCIIIIVIIIIKLVHAIG